MSGTSWLANTAFSWPLPRPPRIFAFAFARPAASRAVRSDVATARATRRRGPRLPPKHEPEPPPARARAPTGVFDFDFDFDSWRLVGACGVRSHTFFFFFWMGRRAPARGGGRGVDAHAASWCCLFFFFVGGPSSFCVAKGGRVRGGKRARDHPI